MTFTPDAQRLWEGFTDEDRARILAGGFCTRCLATRPFTLEQAEMRDGELALIGACNECGSRVVRLLDVAP